MPFKKIPAFWKALWAVHTEVAHISVKVIASMFRFRDTLLNSVLLLKGPYSLNFFKKIILWLFDVFWYFKLWIIPLCYLFLLFRTLYPIFHYKMDSLEEYSLVTDIATSFTCFKSQYYTRKSSFYLFSLVENPIKPRITKSCKNLDKQDNWLRKTIIEFWLANSITLNISYLSCWKDLHELSKEQKLIKWRKGFLRVRRQLLNNVNTGINFSTADNESKNGNLNTNT